MSIRDTALFLENYFIITRDGWEVDVGAPGKLIKLMRNVSSDIQEDSYRCQYAYEALKALADSESEDLAINEIDADVEWKELFRWAESSKHRIELVDKAIKCGADSLYDALSAAQYNERVEVFRKVLSFLKEE